MAYTELLRGSRLARLIRAAPPSERPSETVETACELCALPLPDDHRHLLEVDKQRIRCACRACCVLFDREGARYRVIPDRVLLLDGFSLDDARWEDLAIPVELAYFVRSASGVRAFYPSPLGAAESALGLEAWSAIEEDNPCLEGVAHEVEALLVHRAARAHWVVPIDVCFRLVAIVRSHWRGLSGGDEVWQEVTRFFEALEQRARHIRAGPGDHEEHSACPIKP